jgi:hypothetical protein
MLATGARTVGDTLSGAAYNAADLVRSAGASLSRFLDGPAASTRAQLPASLKQELVCSLLGVLAQHPSAGLALQLPAGEPVELPPLAEEEAAAAAAAEPEATGAEEGAADTQQPADAASPQVNGTAKPAPPPPSGPLPSLGLPSPPAAPASAPVAAPSPAPLPPVEVLHPNAAAHGELQERAVLWLDAAVAALQATGCCLQWEPLLPPPLPGQPPAPKLPAMEAVNLTTVPVDMWLQLLQGTCAASRAVLRAHGHTGLKTVYRANRGRMLSRLTTFDFDGTLARMLEAASISLQTMIQRVGRRSARGRGAVGPHRAPRAARTRCRPWRFSRRNPTPHLPAAPLRSRPFAPQSLTGWRTLALAARPRVLWVAAHYLELPTMLEETWSCLLACVEDTLMRVWRLEGDAHARLLAASAREGLLHKKVQMPQLVSAGAEVEAGRSPRPAGAAGLQPRGHPS